LEYTGRNFLKEVSPKPSSRTFKKKYGIIEENLNNTRNFAYRPCGFATAIFRYEVREYTGRNFLKEVSQTLQELLGKRGRDCRR